MSRYTYSRSRNWMVLVKSWFCVAILDFKMVGSIRRSIFCEFKSRILSDRRLSARVLSFFIFKMYWTDRAQLQYRVCVQLCRWVEISSIYLRRNVWQTDPNHSMVSSNATNFHYLHPSRWKVPIRASNNSPLQGVIQNFSLDYIYNYTSHAKTEMAISSSSSNMRTVLTCLHYHKMDRSALIPNLTCWGFWNSLMNQRLTHHKSLLWSSMGLQWFKWWTLARAKHFLTMPQTYSFHTFCHSFKIILVWI